MIKLPIEEFIFEVREEILCYEELGEAKAAQWEENFRRWLSDAGIKKKNIRKECYCIQDESEIFDIADEYFKAVEEKREEDYWKKFQ